MTYGVIYARYSAGPNQTDQSIDAQIRDCMEYAAKHDIKIIDTYADRHISGKESANRDEFQRMLRDAKKKQFSVVLTWKVDRFGRNRAEIAINKYELKKCGVSVEYAKEHIPDGPEGIILEGLLESMAEYYSAELAQKIHRGQRESVLQGRILTVTPLFGYTKNAEKHYEINPEEAPIVQEIFRLYSEGMPQKDIVGTLYDKGVRNRQGKRFTYNQLHTMLRNRQYIGEYRFGDTVNLAAIPPIIDVNLFNVVQKRIKEMEKPTNHSSVAAKAAAKVTYYLSDKVTCSECGCHYQGESGTSKTGKAHYYYKCHGKKQKKKKCGSRIFQKEWLEDFVLHHTFEDVLTDEMIEKIANKVLEFYEKDSIVDEIKTIKKTLADVQKRLENVLNVIEQGNCSPTLLNRLNELESERDDLAAELASAENKKITITKEHIVYWLELFRDGDIADTDFRKLFFDAFINSIVIYPDHMDVTYNLISKQKQIPYDMDGVRMPISEME